MSKIYDALKRAEREREMARERPREAEGSHPAPAGISSNGRDGDDYRRLRASLLSTPGYSELKTILVTAARHGEGTTRVAVGLAKALAAERDTKVLLLEANLRSPSLVHLIPSGNGTAGLCDLLSGEATPESVITRVSEWNLSIVHAGSKPGAIDCEAILDGIERLHSGFDFVVIDAPPVNRYADVSVLAPKVDGVILVVEADHTPVVDAESAKKSLDRVGARIFGVVLNRQRSYVPAPLQALL